MDKNLFEELKKVEAQLKDIAVNVDFECSRSTERKLKKQIKILHTIIAKIQSDNFDNYN